MTTPQAGSALFSAIMEAPFGALGIRTEAGAVRELTYLPHHFGAKAPIDALSERVVFQVLQYFSDPDFQFSLPLFDSGSDFQKKVWRAIGQIPRGEIRTYGQVARAIGSAPRAVGQACGANWFPLIIPCHRVTASGGLGGFSNHDDENGFHLAVKRWLLSHEGVNTSPWQQQAISF